MMAIGLMKLNAALLSAGASAGEALAAAEEVAAYENRIAKIEGDMLLLKWMVATNVVLTVAVLGIVLRILISLPGVRL